MKLRIISFVPNEFSYSRDPEDEAYINLAVCAETDYLVSRDKDLIDLIIAFTIKPKNFAKDFARCKLLSQ